MHSRSPVSHTFLHVRCWFFSHFASNVHADERLDLLVKDFLQSDSFGTKLGVLPPIGKDVERAPAIMESTARHVGDRYKVGVLWKHYEPKLPYNFQAAHNRLISLEHRYWKDLFLKDACVKAIKGMFSSNHARMLSDAELSLLFQSIEHALLRAMLTIILIIRENVDLFSMRHSHVKECRLISFC